MNSTQNPSSKLDNSNGGRKYDASTRPIAARMLPRAPARNAGNSFNKGAPGRSLAEKGDQDYQRPKPRPNQAQAAHGGATASPPKKPVDFQILLRRCLDGASADKESQAENAEKTNTSLANIYHLFKRVKADPRAKEVLDRAFREAGIKASKNTTSEFILLVKYIYGKEFPRSTASRYANTLQYARVKKVAPQDFVEFVRDEGGTAECARKMAKERKAAAGASGDAEAAAAELIKERLVGAPKYSAPSKMRAFEKGLGALLVKVEEDGSFLVIGHRPVSASAVRSFNKLKARSAIPIMKKRP
jgi:hypothetical protein